MNVRPWPGRTRVVVVGNGMAGFRFVQELTALDRERRFAVTVVGDEPGAAYNRVLLSNVLAGKVAHDDVFLAHEGWYAQHAVTLIAGHQVTTLDRDRRQVRLDDARMVPYDLLVLATGSDAVVPPINGLAGRDGRPVRGITTFRTLADCARIAREATPNTKVVVVGAGVLGLEAARGLAGRGTDVTLVTRNGRLMERQLDAAASGHLRRAAAALGVRTARAGLTRVVAPAGEVRAVGLEDGTAIAADLVVLCCGVAPRIGLARAAGLPVERGVLVDDSLRSPADGRVFAIGECCEHRGRTYGLVAPVWEQARIAARTVAAQEAAPTYQGSPEVTRLKAAGIELVCLGDSVAARPDVDGGEGGYDGAGDDVVQVVTFEDSAQGVYQKLVITGDRLTGAIVLGDTRSAGTLTQLFDRQSILPPDRASLLITRRNAAVTVAQSPTLLPGRATICQCNGVTKAAICAAWGAGARLVSDVAKSTRATTGCGTCRDTVEGLLEWLATADGGATAETGITDHATIAELPEEIPA